jgi:hypothetical protein
MRQSSPILVLTTHLLDGPEQTQCQAGRNEMAVTPVGVTGRERRSVSYADPSA